LLKFIVYCVRFGESDKISLLLSLLVNTIGRNGRVRMNGQNLLHTYQRYEEGDRWVENKTLGRKNTKEALGSRTITRDQVFWKLWYYGQNVTWFFLG